MWMSVMFTATIAMSMLTATTLLAAMNVHANQASMAMEWTALVITFFRAECSHISTLVVVPYHLCTKQKPMSAPQMKRMTVTHLLTLSAITPLVVMSVPASLDTDGRTSIALVCDKFAVNI